MHGVKVFLMAFFFVFNGLGLFAQSSYHFKNVLNPVQSFGYKSIKVKQNRYDAQAMYKMIQGQNHKSIWGSKQSNLNDDHHIKHHFNATSATLCFGDETIVKCLD